MDEEMVWALWMMRGPGEWSIQYMTKAEADEIEALATFPTFSEAKSQALSYVRDAIDAYRGDLRSIKSLTKAQALLQN